MASAKEQPAPTPAKEQQPPVRVPPGPQQVNEVRQDGGRVPLKDTPPRPPTKLK